MHYLSHYLNIRIHNIYKVMKKVIHQFCNASVQLQLDDGGENS